MKVLLYFNLSIFIILLVDFLLFWRRERKPNWPEFILNVQGPAVRAAFGFLVPLGLAKFFLFDQLFARGLQFQFLQTIPAMILAFFLVDFIYYWKHRAEHRWMPLWMVHRIHHSAEEFHGLISFRSSFYSGILFALFVSPLAWLGFSSEILIFHLALSGGLQNLGHLSFVPKLGILDRVFQTPAVHRVHHGRSEELGRRNYGGLLLLWDHLFGTYRAVADLRVKEFGLSARLGFWENIAASYFWVWPKHRRAVGSAASERRAPESPAGE